MSRFDLLFVMLDQLDPESDHRIAAHVIRGHRYRPGHGETGHDSDYDDDDSDDESFEDINDKVHSVWQRPRQQFSQSEYACNSSQKDDPDWHSQDVLQHDFLRKYLHFAKTRMKPVLAEDTREFIANRYSTRK